MKSLRYTNIYWLTTALLNLVVFNNCSHAQSIQKVIQLNCDTKIIVSGLPFNQDLIFTIKCKNIPLAKTNRVFLIENKGKRSGPQSIERYSASTARLNRKSYWLDQKFNPADSSLDVMLVKDRHYYDSLKLSRKLKLSIYPSFKLKLPKGQPKYRLLPSKSYTLYILTGDIDAQTKEIIDITKQIVDARRINPGASTAVLNTTLNTKFTAWINSLQDLYGFIPFSDVDTATLIAKYSRIIGNLDTISANRSDTLNARISRLPLSFNRGDELFLFHLINLLKDTSNTCLKHYRCFDADCSLIKILTGFTKMRDSTKSGLLYEAKANLQDIQNPSFTAIKEEDTEGRKNKQSTTITHLHTVQEFLQSLSILVHDTCYNKELSNCFCADTSFRTKFDTLAAHITNLETDYRSLAAYRNNYLSAIQARADSIATKLFIGRISGFFPANTFIYNFDTRTKQSIIPVFGYAIVGFQKGFTTFTPYTGITFSLQSLDEEVPFNLLRGKTILQRLNFTVGFTLASIKEEGKRADLFSNNSNLLAGLGFKLNHVISLNGGAMIFRKEDPNPFISYKKVTTAPYAGLSINLKVQALFEGFKNLILAK